MSKKNNNLLNENQIRRFMKLARLEPISNSFIKRLNENCPFGEKENLMEEEDEEVKIEDVVPVEGSSESPIEPEEGVGGEGKEGMVKNLVDAIANAIEQATGVEVDVEGNESEEVGGEMDEVPSSEEVEIEDELQPSEEIDEEAPLEEAKELVKQTPEKISGQKDMKMKEGETGRGPGSHDLKPAEKVPDSLINEVVKRVLKRILPSKSK